jgi:hypothetical protein
MLTSWCNENAIMSIFINYDTWNIYGWRPILI